MAFYFVFSFFRYWLLLASWGKLDEGDRLLKSVKRQTRNTEHDSKIRVFLSLISQYP